MAVSSSFEGLVLSTELQSNSSLWSNATGLIVATPLWLEVVQTVVFANNVLLVPQEVITDRPAHRFFGIHLGEGITINENRLPVSPEAGIPGPAPAYVNGVIVTMRVPDEQQEYHYPLLPPSLTA